MQKIFTFRVSLMNGTVTANTHVEACATRELAEQVRKAIQKANEHNDTLDGMSLWFSEVKELTLWENADEVPVLNPKPPTSEELEQEREEIRQCLKNVKEGMSTERQGSYGFDWMSRLAARHEQRMKEIEAELEKIGKGIDYERD